MKTLLGLLFACLAIFFAYLALFSSGCSTSEPDTSKATTYSIYKVRDFSIPGRVRKNWLGHSAAIDFESRAQTAIKAALEIQKSSDAQVVQVCLTTRNSHHELANAWYAKDGKGMNGVEDWKWEVSAVHGDPSYNLPEVYEIK